jgi:hypothetical protein
VSQRLWEKLCWFIEYDSKQQEHRCLSSETWKRIETIFKNHGEMREHQYREQRNLALKLCASPTKAVMRLKKDIHEAEKAVANATKQVRSWNRSAARS